MGETTFAPYDLEVGQADSIDLVLFGNRVNTFGAVHMVGEDDRFLNPGSWRTQDDGWSEEYVLQKVGILSAPMIATVYKGNIIKNLIMDCQSYTKYRPNETTGGIFVSWRRKEELPTGA